MSGWIESRLAEKDMVQRSTYISGTLNQVEAHFNDNIILVAKNLGDATGDPSVEMLAHATDGCAWCGWTNFFMTARLTFCMSTFLLNSGGNLVVFNNRASVLDAILPQDVKEWMQDENWLEMCRCKDDASGTDGSKSGGGRPQLSLTPALDCTSL